MRTLINIVQVAWYVLFRFDPDRMREEEMI